tara:strand:- start:9065 stop:10459 length:1395 start_codon:yes stop_codon:yes gene_type:complete
MPKWEEESAMFKAMMLAWVLIGMVACASKPVDWAQVESQLVSSSQSQKFGALPILQGPTSPTETVFRVLHPKKDSYRYFIQGKTYQHWVDPRTQALKYHSDQVMDEFRIEVKGDQNPLKLYVLKSSGELVDTREFSFLPAKQNNLKVVIASCMDDQFPEVQKIMWNHVWEKNPDALFLIGDNVYADAHLDVLTHKKIKPGDGEAYRALITPKNLEGRYIQTRQDLLNFRMKKLIPTFSVWDDHDYGSNNGGEDFAYKSEVTKFFTQFFPVENLGKSFAEKGPGVSSVIRFSKVDVFLLDDRSFRTSQTHFGKEQSEWLFQNLNPKKLSVLVSGDQWFGGYHKFESFEGNQPEDFKNFLQKLKSKKAKVFFVSGDRHLTEIMKVAKKHTGFKTFEVTTSGIHANMYPGAFKRDPSPNQLIGVDGEFNFSTFTFHSGPSGKSVKSIEVESQGKDKVLFRKTLKITR